MSYWVRNCKLRVITGFAKNGGKYIEIIMLRKTHRFYRIDRYASKSATANCSSSRGFKRQPQRRNMRHGNTLLKSGCMWHRYVQVA